MTGITIGYDATHANISHLPPGQALGYGTGGPGIQWTAADGAAHPGWVQIEQQPVLTANPYTGDVIDVEAAAANGVEAAQWALHAWADYEAAVRPGQRVPLVYGSLSIMDTVTADLKAAGVQPGRCGIYVAHWDISQATATSALGTTINGYTIHIMQFANNPFFDVNVIDAGWLTNVSRKTPPTPGVLGVFAPGKPVSVASFQRLQAVSSSDGGKTWH